MAKAGAPIGNKNAVKGKASTDALRLELAQDRDALRKIWRSIINKAVEGDLQAAKEINDRLEGRPAQTVQGPNDDGSHTLTVKLHAVD